jgi:hypothetical protein
MGRKKKIHVMRRLTITFDLYQYELLKSQAQERDVSIADIVRELVDKYVASTRQTDIQNKTIIA